MDTTPRYVVRDRDGIYGKVFQRRVENLGIEEVVLRRARPATSRAHRAARLATLNQPQPDPLSSPPSLPPYRLAQLRQLATAPRAERIARGASAGLAGRVRRVDGCRSELLLAVG